MPGAAQGGGAGSKESQAGCSKHSWLSAAQTSSSSSSAAAGPRLHRVQTRGASQGVEVEAGQQQQQPEGEGDEDDKGLGFRLNRSLGGFIATGVSLAGLLLDELHDCGLQWDCCPWWIAKQEELQAGGLPAPSRASHYQAALLHSMVKDQGVWEDYLNYCECMGRLLTEWQNLHLKEYYSFHAPALVMPLKQLAGIVSSW
uniref:Uncharacterized protein n=1 Tax=Dunaliella tertiolecta TaxID=3047 RepID=A0A7S3VNY3_DUNTE